MPGRTPTTTAAVVDSEETDANAALASETSPLLAGAGGRCGTSGGTSPNTSAGYGAGIVSPALQSARGGPPPPAARTAPPSSSGLPDFPSWLGTGVGAPSLAWQARREASSSADASGGRLSQPVAHAGSRGLGAAALAARAGLNEGDLGDLGLDAESSSEPELDDALMLPHAHHAL